MDLFYLNGSPLLFCSWNDTDQMLHSVEKMKKKFKGKKNTIHSFADSVLFGLFSLFFLFNGL